MRYGFDTFVLDSASYELTRGGTAIQLQPKVFELLSYLVACRDRVVPRDELLRTIWPDVHVSDSALAWCVSQARRALGQERTSPTPIETVHGRGYRFRALVRAIPDVPGTREVPAEEPRSNASSGAFVGRVQIMAGLRATFDRVKRSGIGAGAVLVGEAGIGKTRCAAELSAELKAEGTDTWIARCHEEEGPPILWPFIQILRDCERVSSGPATSPNATELLAMLVPEARDMGESSFAGGRSGAFWLLDGIVRCVLAYGKLQPRLLLVDDLQWADELSLRAFDFLGAALPSSPIFLLATSRTTEDARPEPGVTSLGKVMRRLTPVPLHGLSRSELAEYVHAATGREPVVEVLNAVLEKTAGNPLFVEEVVQHLAEHAARGAFAVTGLETPRVARDLIQGRLSLLGETVRSTLEAASILGETFEIPVLGAMLGKRPEEVLKALQAATSARLLGPPVGVGHYAFTHALVRDAVRSSIPEARRRELHLLAGETLEARALNDEKTSQLAFHFHQALPLGLPGKAVQYSMRAARASSNVFAYEEAKALSLKALEAQEYESPQDGGTRSQILLGLALSEFRLGARDDGQRHLEQSVAIAKEHGTAMQLVAIGRALRVSVSSPLPPNPAARDALSAALERTTVDDAPRAEALSELAAIASFSLPPEECRALSDQALAIARPLGGTALLEALRSRLFWLSGPDDIDELLAVASEILAADTRCSFPWSGEAHYAQFSAHLYRGSMSEAELALEAYGRVAHLRHLQEAIWAYDRLRAQLWFQRGEFARAENAWIALAERGEKTSSLYERTVYMTHQVTLNRERGIRAIPSEETRTLLARWMSQGLHHRERAQAIGAMLYEGREDEARAAYEALLRPGLSSFPRNLGYLAALASLALAAIEFGDVVRAKEVYERLLPYQRHNTPDRWAFTMGSVAHYLGVLSEFIGRPDAAREHFEVALSRNEEMGLRPCLCRTLLAYGRMLSATEEDRSRALVARAAEMAGELGMRQVLDDARAWLEGA